MDDQPVALQFLKRSNFKENTIQLRKAAPNGVCLRDAPDEPDECWFDNDVTRY